MPKKELKMTPEIKKEEPKSHGKKNYYSMVHIANTSAENMHIGTAPIFPKFIKIEEGSQRDSNESVYYMSAREIQSRLFNGTIKEMTEAEWMKAKALDAAKEEIKRDAAKTRLSEMGFTFDDEGKNIVDVPAEYKK